MGEVCSESVCVLKVRCAAISSLSLSLSSSFFLLCFFIFLHRLDSTDSRTTPPLHSSPLRTRQQHSTRTQASTQQQHTQHTEHTQRNLHSLHTTLNREDSRSFSPIRHAQPSSTRCHTRTRNPIYSMCVVLRHCCSHQFTHAHVTAHTHTAHEATQKRE